MAVILYTALVLGAVMLYLLLRPGAKPVKIAAGVIGLGAVAWAFKALAEAIPGAGAAPGDGGAPPGFFLLFAIIAVGAAVRMITNPRPVYSALSFVMVVLSSSGIFLLLEAEFMAFALIIVYAGAILITYLFVIMLAQQAREHDQEQEQADYDRRPREPAAAVFVGFVLLAVLGDMISGARGVADLPPPPSESKRLLAAAERLEAMPGRLERVVHDVAPGVIEREMPPELLEGLGSEPGYQILRADNDRRVQVIGGRLVVNVVVTGFPVLPHESMAPEPVVGIEVPLPDDAVPENIQDVGLALVGRFPASLELAGVILTMAMFGAVVLAQRQIELSEAQKRALPGSGADIGGGGP